MIIKEASQLDMLVDDRIDELVRHGDVAFARITPRVKILWFFIASTAHKQLMIWTTRLFVGRFFCSQKIDNSCIFVYRSKRTRQNFNKRELSLKVVNCTTSEQKRKNEIEPCNECDQCVSITNGTNMDVLEIDAASNRGIDEIRDLKEKIRLSPVAAKRKV